MSTLRLFGLRLHLQNSVILPPESILVTVRRWQGSLSDDTAFIEALLEVAGHHTILLRAHFLTSVDTAGDRVVKEGDHVQPDSSPAYFRLWEGLVSGNGNPGDALVIQAGALQWTHTDTPLNFVRGVVLDGSATSAAELVFGFADQSVHTGETLPIGLQTQTAGGCTLNLPEGTLLFTERAFALNTEAPLLVNDGSGNAATLSMFVQQFPSRYESTGVILTAPVSAPALRFRPRDANHALPLYARRLAPDSTFGIPTKTAPLAAELTAHGFEFHVTLGLNGNAPVFDALHLQKPDEASHFVLKPHRLAALDNETPVLHVLGDLELHVVAQTGSQPATLAIAPTVSEPGIPLEYVPSDANMSWHGFTPNLCYTPSPTGALHVKHAVAHEGDLPGGIRAEKVTGLTIPHLEFIGSNTLRIPRGGESFHTGANTDAQTHALTGHMLVTPLLGDHWFTETQAHRDAQTAHLAALNMKMKELSQELPSAEHETHMIEGPVTGQSLVQAAQVFASQAASASRHLAMRAVPSDALQLKSYSIKRKYGPLTVQIKLPEGQMPDFVFFTDSGDNSMTIERDHGHLPLEGPFTLEKQTPPNGRPIGLVKLSQQFTLQEILTAGQASFPSLTDEYIQELLPLIDPSIAERAWMGAMLFDAKVHLVPQEGNSKHTLIANTLGAAQGSLTIRYAAVTPSKTTSTKDDYSFAGRLIYHNPERPDAHDGHEASETRYRLNSADIEWYDNALRRLDVSTEFHFRTFLGMNSGLTSGNDPGNKLTVEGAIDRKTEIFRLRATLATDLKLLGDKPQEGPFKQVYLRGAEIIVAGKDQTALSVDGHIELQNFGGNTGDWFKTGGVHAGFRDLRIRLKSLRDLPTPSGDWLSIDYPSLDFRFGDLPPFTFAGLNLSLRGFSVNFPRLSLPTSVIPLDGKPDNWGTLLNFDLRLDLGKLPALALSPLDGLIFDFKIGFDILKDLGKFDPNSLRVGLTGLGGGKLNINLLGFLEIKSEKAGVDSNWLYVENVQVLVLGKEVIDHLNLYVFRSQTGQGGFLIYYAPNNPPHAGITWQWILVSQNVSIGPELAAKIMAVELQDEGERKRISADLRTAFDNGKFLTPPPGSQPLYRGAWLFGAGFDFFGLFDGKFLYQEGAYFGIAIGGGKIKDWLGYDIAISVLHVRGERREDDRFITSVRVPRLTLPAFQFTGGELRIGVGVNGYLLVDIGYPWLEDNQVSRQWHRALGAICTPFQGSGGLYFTTRHVSRQNTDGRLLSIGYAVQFGLGFAAGAGPFSVWGTLGIYFLLEGDLLLWQGTIGGFRLTGAVGILLRVAGELNWWIISIRIEITLAAEARVTAIWGYDPANALPAPGTTLPDNSQPLKLVCDLTVYASVSARACIGGGWFKICAGISVTLPLRVSHTISF
jgi:hypothetical protein